MRLREIMLSSPPRIAIESPVASALSQIALSDVPSLLVFDRKKVVGVVSERDLLAVKQDEREKRLVRHVFRPIRPLTGESTIKDAANAMRGENVECVPVSDDGIIGVVTVDRLLELIGRGALHAVPNRERPVLARRSTKHVRQPVTGKEKYGPPRSNRPRRPAPRG